MREAVFAALRKDPELLPKVKGTLRERIDESDGALSTVVQSAAAIEPIIRAAVKKRPSRLGFLGLHSAHLLADLAMADERSNRRLAAIAKKGTVGIVFIDIADFTVFTAKYGDDRAVRIVAKLDRLIKTAIREPKGEVVKKLGDGFLLAFPSASQAVRGAVAIRGRVTYAGATEVPVKLRIAVHAGEPLIEQDDLLGHDVNLTARLLDHCKPHQIIVSEAAKDLAEKRLRSVPFGGRRAVKIRGLTSKAVVYTL